MRRWIENIRVWLSVLWSLLRRRPICRCPICNGKGGQMSRGEEPEWSECECCWDSWNDLEEVGGGWFVGRCSPWQWLRAKLSIRCGLWYPTRIRYLIRCKLGWHRWITQTYGPDQMTFCPRCWSQKVVEKAKVPA